MFTSEQRQILAAKLARPYKDYMFSDIYSDGVIRFNFQVSTTINPRKPFEKISGDYEKSLAGYFTGDAASLSNNGGGLVIVRGATGSGKTTAIERAIKLSRNSLMSKSGETKLDVIYLEFNNITEVYESDGERLGYVWRTFATEISRVIESSHLASKDTYKFIRWLGEQTKFVNQMEMFFRFIEKNRSFLHGVHTGNGFAGYDVDHLLKRIQENWEIAVDGFSTKELAIHKIARLRYDIEHESTEFTHRVIIVDNVDHLPPGMQRQIIDTAIDVSEFLGVRLLIAVRPLTWENQQGHKHIQIEEHRSPSVSDVLCKRLEHIRRYETTDPEFISSINTLERELNDKHSHMKNILYGISGVGIRTALRNFQNFLHSPLIEKVVFRTTDGLRPSQIARAFLMGDENSIDHDNIEDIYSVGNVRDARRSLLKPRIVDYVLRVRGGRTMLSEVVRSMEKFGYNIDESREAIHELMYRKRSLLWLTCDHQLLALSDTALCSILSIAPMGASYYSRLFGEYLYSESCVALGRDHKVSVSEVLNFSRNFMIEDERQISIFIKSASAADYYAMYGLETPSLAYIYWEKFEIGLKARQSTEYDTGWKSRVRGFLEGQTRLNYHLR